MLSDEEKKRSKSKKETKKRKKEKEKHEKKKRKHAEDGEGGLSPSSSSSSFAKSDGATDLVTPKKSKRRRDSLPLKNKYKASDNEGDIDPPLSSADCVVEQQQQERPLVESSGLPPGVTPDPSSHRVTLLLFYQYVEPPWSDGVYKQVLKEVEPLAHALGVTGRMRIAKEGFNCTLTTTADDAQSSMRAFCTALRRWKPECFRQTEFKLTHHLPDAQRFASLKIIPVTELVHYGLDGAKAPPIQLYSGVHLEPQQYHQQLADPDTVVIDVRNHYEANIGRFDPPAQGNPHKFLDPKMRKSTEFPVWLDSEETREKLRGKNVAMYCTGGIRCERASALLKYKMANDPSVQELGIKNVFQLQGGIDKYFKEFPDGGYWKGINYVFDKRFAHAPVEKEVHKMKSATTTAIHTEPDVDDASNEKPAANATNAVVPMGKCEACSKPWDKYRGKRRCPTCGVPSLICRDCWQSDQNGTKKLDKSIRCDLCVEQDIQSKKKLREKEQRELEEYESRLQERGLLCPPQLQQPTTTATDSNPNPNNVTRLFLKNMCRQQMTQEILMEHLPGITHIVWRTDRGSNKFSGQGWVEMESPEAAAAAVIKSGLKALGRPLYVEYQPPDGKDLWPPPRSAVR